MVPALAELAWTLATSPSPDTRDRAEAVQFAEQGAALTRRQNPVVLDALAAAYAASGQFDRAVTTEEAAIAIARSAPTGDLMGLLLMRPDLYRKGLPFRRQTR